jgi:nucleoside-diphosphate-sugar epimerase
MMDIAKKRIALIGGAGFIGHHLALHLQRLGAEVMVIDSLNVNNLYALQKNADQNPHASKYLQVLQQRFDLLEQHHVPLVVQDAREYRQLSKLLQSFDPDTIVQLAAVANANISNKDPFSTFDHSLRTLENALDIARSKSMNTEHFIYISSSMVYGHFEGGMVTEDTQCNPLGIYGALKFAGEKMVIAYNQVFDLPYTIVRPSALYGERCISRRVSQIFVENAMQGEDITVSGDGSDRLDFTYVGDLVSGLCNVIENERSRGQTFNLTYGRSRSIGELADIVAQHLPEANVMYQPKDRLTPSRGTLSVDRAKELIGYRPRYPLELGMAQYIRWYRSFMDDTQRHRAEAAQRRKPPTIAQAL